MYLSSKQSGNMSSYYEELKVRQKTVWISYSDVGFSEYSTVGIDPAVRVSYYTDLQKKKKKKTM